MYWFTYWDSGGVPEAIYNGRFTFVRNLQKKDAAAFINGVGVSKKVAQILLHEKIHKEIFLKTDTGLLLLGLRLIARFNARIKPNKKAIKTYYLARAIFYRNMYALHEDIAKSQEREPHLDNMEVALNADERHKLAIADQRVLGEWKEIGVAYSKIVNMLLRRLGNEYCRHFTLVAGEWRDGVWVEENFTRSGIVNDRGSNRENESYGALSVKKISKYAQVEHWTRKNHVSDWEWMLSKFQAEYTDFVKNGGDKSKFHLYVHQAITFAAQWSQVDLWELPIEVSEHVVSSLDQRETPQPHSIWQETKGFRKMINLFYLHGN